MVKVKAMETVMKKAKAKVKVTDRVKVKVKVREKVKVKAMVNTSMAMAEVTLMGMVNHAHTVTEPAKTLVVAEKAADVHLISQDYTQLGTVPLMFQRN
jgi:hypothetical protein